MTAVHRRRTGAAEASQNRRVVVLGREGAASLPDAEASRHEPVVRVRHHMIKRKTAGWLASA